MTIAAEIHNLFPNVLLLLSVVMNLASYCGFIRSLCVFVLNREQKDFHFRFLVFVNPAK
jgi:hypothetical protein